MASLWNWSSYVYEMMKSVAMANLLGLAVVRVQKDDKPTMASLWNRPLVVHETSCYYD